MSVSKQLKKRKLEDNKRIFQEQWTDKFCFIEHKGNIIRLICKATITVLKDYNLKRHFQNNHSDLVKGILMLKNTMVQLLQEQQNIFKKCNESVEQAV